MNKNHQRLLEKRSIINRSLVAWATKQISSRRNERRELGGDMRHTSFAWR
jgi:hypothetical protein